MPMELLFVGACLGHLAVVIAHHNWWYGQRLPRRCGLLLHASHGLMIAAFPVFLWYGWGLHLDGLFVPSSAPAWQVVVAGYVVVCAAVAVLALPANIAAKLLRHNPAEDGRSQVLDVAKNLGYRPLGGGRGRFLAALPANQALQVELVERTLRLNRLPPALDGLTVLHLSDLHLRGTPDRDWYRFIMDRCAEWRPDIVALTGDVADSWHYMRWVVPVLGRLRWQQAACAILGNHDYWYDPRYIRRRLGRLGVRVLANTWERLEVRGEPLIVVGHEGPWLRPPPDLSGCPDEPFRLCLSHTPDNIRWAQKNSIDLMLAGHVHGGQVRLPVVGSILVPSRYGRWYDCGTFAEGPTVLHVTRGLSGQYPLRWNCRPEVVLLTLRRT
jgi:predicted MPP superfamily phosphohydrolase